MNSATTLRAFYEEAYEPLRLRGKTDNARRLHEVTLRNFDKFLERTGLLGDLTDETVSRYLDWFLKHDGGRSPHTVNKERGNLLALWRFACRRINEDGRPLIAAWPNVQAENAPHEDPVAWMPGELSRLFSSFRYLWGTIAGIPESQWWLAIHCVLWDTGERINPMLQARWKGMDLEGGFMYVPAADRKGKTRGRTYQLHPRTVAILKEIKGERGPDDLVFPWDKCPSYLYKRYRTILKRAKLSHDRKSKFHRLRRSVASHAEAAGMNATEILGHSSRAVTKRYLDPRIVKQPHPADVLFRPDVG